MRFKALLAAAIFLLPSISLAQTSPNLTKGQVLTAGQWNLLFAGKQDTLGYRPVNSAGDVMTGRLITAAPGATLSGFNLTPGTASASPANGDVWMTTAGVFAQVNGVTVGPLSGPSGGSFAATAPLSVSFPASVTTYSCTTCVTLTASQTLTNKTLTAPVMTTPTLGVAIGTSLALGGAAIGGNALAVTGTSAFNAAVGIASNSTLALYVGANGATNPAFQVDASTGSVATGIKVTGGAAAGGVAIAAISSGTNEGLSINAKGSGGVFIGGSSTGLVQLGNGGGGVTIGSALTYGGVTLSNSVSGTGSMVLANSPTFSGTVAGNGTHPVSLLAPGTQDTIVGYFSSTAASALAINNCANALTYNTTTHVFGCNVGAGTGTVTTAGVGLTLTGGGTTLGLSTARQTQPTSQKFLSGSGTYTTPANVLSIKITLVAAGGGGEGSGTTHGNGGTGGATCWNTTGAACTTPVYQASGGGGATSTTGGTGGSTTGSGTCDMAIQGGGGNSSAGAFATSAGGGGGNGYLGGGGSGGAPGVGGVAGSANTGGGGGGASANGTAGPGAGGGAGGTCIARINAPAATYTYAAGAAGTAGTAGTSGFVGGLGATSGIWVEEFYN